METVKDFPFWPPNSPWMMTAVTKLRYFLLGRKVMTNLDNVLKSGDVSLPTEVHIVKTMAFPKVMYRHESWTTQKAEC